VQPRVTEGSSRSGQLREDESVGTVRDEWRVPNFVLLKKDKNKKKKEEEKEETDGEDGTDGTRQRETAGST
jgi:hypothetical protein